MKGKFKFTYWKFEDKKSRKFRGLARMKLVPFNIITEQFYDDVFLFKSQKAQIKEHLKYKLEWELKNNEMIVVPADSEADVYASKILRRKSGVLVDELGNDLREVKAVMPISDLENRVFTDAYSGIKGRILDVYQEKHDITLLIWDGRTGNTSHRDLDGILL